jgi:hypothetical protein
LDPRSLKKLIDWNYLARSGLAKKLNAAWLKKPIGWLLSLGAAWKRPGNKSVIIGAQ